MIFEWMLFRIPYLEVCTNVNALEHAWLHQHVADIQKLLLFRGFIQGSLTVAIYIEI